MNANTAVLLDEGWTMQKGYVAKREPIASRYSLERLETLVLKDIERLEEQLERVEQHGWNDERMTTAIAYREMIQTRKQLLEKIRSQANAFHLASQHTAIA